MVQTTEKKADNLFLLVIISSKIDTKKNEKKAGANDQDKIGQYYREKEGEEEYHCPQNHFLS